MLMWLTMRMSHVCMVNRDYSHLTLHCMKNPVVEDVCTISIIYYEDGTKNGEKYN